MSDDCSRGQAQRRPRQVTLWGVAAAVALCIVGAAWTGQPRPTQDARERADTLHPRQVEAVKDFATSAQDTVAASFPVQEGAAVPNNVALQDMPRALGEVLPAYINDQYVVAARRFVIVEKNTRRIIAVVPVG